MLCVSRRSLYALLRFRFRQDATAAVSFSSLLSNPVPFRSFTHGSGESASTPPLDRQSSALKQPPVSQSMSGLLQPTTCEVKIAILKLLVIRDFEWANLVLRFEQENHYCVVDVCYPQSEVFSTHYFWAFVYSVLTGFCISGPIFLTLFFFWSQNGLTYFLTKHYIFFFNGPLTFIGPIQILCRAGPYMHLRLLAVTSSDLCRFLLCILVMLFSLVYNTGRNRKECSLESRLFILEQEMLSYGATARYVLLRSRFPLLDASAMAVVILLLPWIEFFWLSSGHLYLVICSPQTPEVKITLLPQSNVLSLTSQQVGFMKGPSNLIAREVHTQPDPRILLLQAVSKRFEEHFEFGLAKEGSALHSLVIKLGIEYQNHRNLITLYGREINLYRESVIKVVNMIDKSYLFYKSLTPMIHSFAFMSPRDSRAALGLIMKLGTPRVDSMSGFLLAIQYHCLRNEQKVAWAVEGVVRLSLHYKIPLFPRVMGGIIQLYTATYMLDEAMETLKELPSDRIDEYMITSIFDACTRIEDISTAASLIRILKEKGVKYRLNEVFKTTFAYHQMSEEFGDNVTFYAKKPGFSRKFSVSL